jgi:uncharacterized membrane protein YccC
MTDSEQIHAGKHAELVAGHLSGAEKRLTLRERALIGGRHAVMSGAAAILAYVPTKLLGSYDGFWSAITAIGVVQTQFGATRTTARDQFVGAALGGVIGVLVALFIGANLFDYTGAVLASILACWLLNVATAARLAGVTTTIILLVPHNGVTPEQMFVTRVSVVGWGVAVAIAVVWFGKLTGFTQAKAK